MILGRLLDPIDIKYGAAQYKATRSAAAAAAAASISEQFENLLLSLLSRVCFAGRLIQKRKEGGSTKKVVIFGKEECFLHRLYKAVPLRLKPVSKAWWVSQISSIYIYIFSFSYLYFSSLKLHAFSCWIMASPLVARKGRNLQRYEDHLRLVAGYIAFPSLKSDSF